MQHALAAIGVILRHDNVLSCIVAHHIRLKWILQEGHVDICARTKA